MELCRNNHIDMDLGRREEGREEENLLNSINISEMSFNLPKGVGEEELAAAREKLREL